MYFGLRELFDDAEMLRQLGLSQGLSGKRIIVQGLGNVGYHAAHFCQEAGAVITGIAEREGGIFNADGLDVDAVVQAPHRHAARSCTTPGRKTWPTRPQLLEYECDVLLPAALENQIHEGNAARIKAKIIAEGANGPVTQGAEKMLLARGIVVLPDLYLNAGGVTVSYFEWLKNLSNVRFGRMGKRAEEASLQRLVTTIEQTTGKTISRAGAGADCARRRRNQPGSFGPGGHDDWGLPRDSGGDAPGAGHHTTCARRPFMRPSRKWASAIRPWASFPERGGFPPAERPPPGRVSAQGLGGSPGAYAAKQLPGSVGRFPGHNRG